MRGGVLGRLRFERQVPFDADTGFWDYNPLGKVPTLLMDGGQSVYGGPKPARWFDSIQQRPSVAFRLQWFPESRDIRQVPSPALR